MSNSAPSTTTQDPASQWKLLTGGKPDRHSALGKPLVVILVCATLFRMWMALYGSQGVVSEESYAVLRQSRHWFAGHGFAFQPGLADGGLPGPHDQPLTLFALWLAPLQALLGSATPAFLLTFNTLLWTCAVLALLRPMRPSTRPTMALLLCLAPAFVDGAIQGTSAEWLGFLLAMSYAAISVGRTATSLVWFTLAVLSSPSMFFFLPVWAAVHTGRLGVRFGGGTLLHYRNALAIAIPIGLWAFLNERSAEAGTLTAWVQWFDGLAFQWDSFGAFWLGLPRFSLLPWVAASPLPVQHLAAMATALLIAWITWANVRSETVGSRGWLCFFYLALAFGLGHSTLTQPGIPSASILPSLALVMAMVPLILPHVSRLHETRLLRGTALILLTLAMPIAFGRTLDLRTQRQSLEEAAAFLETTYQQGVPPPVLTSEAPHFGYLFDGPVLTPHQPWRTEHDPAPSFAQVAQLSDCAWILISETQLANNQMAGVGTIWSSESDHDWWNQNTDRRATFGAWHLYRVPNRAVDPTGPSVANPVPN